MESPPSSSSWSQPFILSDDSGLLITTGSYSSGSTSFESRSGKRHFHFEDSDCEEKSLSQDDSLDGMSDVMCGENFNTLKKGPNWTDIKQSASPIEPPLEFQDRPNDTVISPVMEFYCDKLTKRILLKALLDFRDEEIQRLSDSSNLDEPEVMSPPPLPSRQLNYVTPPVCPLPEFSTNFSTICRSSSYVYYASPYRSLNKTHLKHNISFSSPTSNFASSASNFASSASPYVSHTPRPSSRSSLGGSSRLSSSHNSLFVPHARRVDDSSFITQAVSHDTLSSNQISDLYNVPFDSDVYAVPVDVVRKPAVKPKRGGAYSNFKIGNNLLSIESRKRRRNNSAVEAKDDGKSGRSEARRIAKKNAAKSEQSHWIFQSKSKRHSVAGTSATQGNEPIHMTLQEVRNYLQTLYSSSSESSDAREDPYKKKQNGKNGVIVVNNKYNNNNYHSRSISCIGNNHILSRPKKSTFLINIKNKKVKDSCDNSKALTISPVKKEEKKKKIFNFRQALCNIFRFRRFLSVEEKSVKTECGKDKLHYEIGPNLEDLRSSLSCRALPPLPKKEDEVSCNVEQALDFATSIQRVKDYGWYWGPISSEVAEKILSNEPDGSFIVRDSSDDHYIFSLTFKLNNSVRHVRIEHDQGNFSFGSCTKFKSQTIVEFIENAVEHSRSGRYLFFLHRRPVIGPVRVQLLHPVSRFKQVQSLQHMCRFVIHKNVRRDLLAELPLPRRMIDYLNTPHYYSEHFIDVGEGTNEQRSPSSGDNTMSRSRFLPPVPSNVSSTVPGDHADSEPAANLIPVHEYIVLNNGSQDN